MKVKLKTIVTASIAVILLTLVVIFNVPHNLNNTLRFDDSEWIFMTVSIMKNVEGRIVSESEQFTFEKGTAEFTDINNVLGGYSYNRTFARDERVFSGTSNITSITILGENSSTLFLVNIAGANMKVNGTIRRMRQNTIIELIDRILEICEM